MPRLLVTGGCGFIGSNFIRNLLETDSQAEIINVDALTYAGNLKNLADLAQHPRYRFIKADITDRDAMRAFMPENLDALIHFAAESHVDRSILDSGPFVRTNVLGTQILLDTAREKKVGRFVHVSTDEVYGTLGATGLFTEETPLAPNSPYSASKAASDLLVRAYHETFGMDTIITRCSNNYGPYQFPEKLIPLFISNLVRGMQVPVYGDGLQIRDWIHVLDHARGVEAAWRKGKSGQVYNFGGRCEKTNISLTKTLITMLGKDESSIKYVQDRPGHDRRYAIDCTKAEKELDWKPQYVFEDGLKETIQWYLSHADWVEEIRSGEYRHYYEKQYSNR